MSQILASNIIMMPICIHSLPYKPSYTHTRASVIHVTALLSDILHLSLVYFKYIKSVHGIGRVGGKGREKVGEGEQERENEKDKYKS